jgi:hypothetical protein
LPGVLMAAADHQHLWRGIDGVDGIQAGPPVNGLKHSAGKYQVHRLARTGLTQGDILRSFIIDTERLTGRPSSTSNCSSKSP